MNRTLTEFFQDKNHRSVKVAKRLLTLSVGAVANADVIPYLSAETLVVAGEWDRIAIHFAPPAADFLRPSIYTPPEVDSDPWLQNQYSLGVCFHRALAQVSNHDSQAVGIPVGTFVPALRGGFSAAVRKMVDPDPAKRFESPARVQRFIEGIGEGAFGKLVATMVVVFVSLVAVALGFILGPAAWDAIHRGIGASRNSTPQAAVRADGSASEHGGMSWIAAGSVQLPEGPREVKSFYLDSFEVSNGRFAAWAAKAGKTLPVWESGQSPGHPAWDVSWDDAREFCAASGRRLPTEAEWQRAWDTAAFRWGAGPPDASAANVESGDLRDTGATPGDRSAAGIYDLAGNLPEWTADSLPGSGDKIVRGGGYYLPAALALQRLAIPPALPAAEGHLRVGFRCASQ